MIKTQIQVPEELLRELRSFAERREWSRAETFRRGSDPVLWIGPSFAANVLFGLPGMRYGVRMNEIGVQAPAGEPEAADAQRRLELARRAFKDFYAQCFWSYRPDAEITEDKIPFVIRGLREHGGLAGYRVAAKLCH